MNQSTSSPLIIVMLSMNPSRHQESLPLRWKQWPLAATQPERCHGSRQDHYLDDGNATTERNDLWLSMIVADEKHRSV
jgi:hypothetical protein